MDELTVGNWDLKRQRYCAWWRRELADPIIGVVSPRARPLFDVPEPVVPDDADRFWCDPRFVLESSMHQLSTLYYGGDAVPTMRPDLGPSALAAFAGASLGFTPHTAWVGACIDDLDSWPTPTFDPGNHYVLIVAEKLRALLEAAQGRYFVSHPDLTDGVTMLSQMRGTEKFCFDLKEQPEAVKRLRDGMTELWIDAYKYFNAMIRDAGQDGSADWVRLWAPGPYSCTQCDFCFLIGPQDFEWLVLPEQRAETSMLSQSIFHLDGPGEIVHLDRLLELETLDAIQWVPGAGAPSASGWIPLARRVLEGGKNLVLYPTADELQPVLDQPACLGDLAVFVAAQVCGPTGKAAELFPFRITQVTFTFVDHV